MFYKDFPLFDEMSQVVKTTKEASTLISRWP